MKYNWIILNYSFFLITIFYPVFSKAQEPPTIIDSFDWKQIENIPTPPIDTKGSFSTYYKEFIIVAGGYDIDERTYLDLIQIFNHTTREWSILDIKLDEEVGYGNTIVANNGVYIFGGLNDERVSKKVTHLGYDNHTDSWSKESKPDIPNPVALSGACMLNGKIYLAGGINKLGSDPSSDFYQFDYYSNEWSTLNQIPVSTQILPPLVVQNNGENDLIYLLTTSDLDHPTSVLLSYNPTVQNWQELSSSPIMIENPFGIAKGGFNILFLSGMNDSPLGIEHISEHKMGHNLLYHTITNIWTTIDKINIVNPTALLQHENEIYLLTEENSQLSFYSSIAKYENYGLRFFDIVGLITYIVLLLYMGYFFSNRSNNTNDYFRGGKRIPAWAAGISIIATKLSAVTFISIPAKVFASNWLYILIPLNGLFLAFFVIKIVLPFFHQLDITSAYEYLEKRFNIVVRIIGSSTYLLWEIGRTGILLLLPALVISVVLNIDLYLCIVIIGIIATVYTLLGGMEAVIWTDVFQVFIMLGGIILTLVVIIYKMDASIPELFQSAATQNKLTAFDFNFDFTTATVWVIMLGWIGRMQEYVSTQSIVQRFITVKDEKAAGNSMWISAIVVIPVIIFFYMVGTGLFLYYQEFPQYLDPNLDQLDAILPFFIITQLPEGIAGLVIAAIFATAMSSLDSGIHSMSTVITTDFYKRFTSNFNEETSIKLAKYLVTILGILGTASAMLMAGLPIQSLFDQLMLVMGLFGGGLAGVFLVGMLSMRTHATGVIIGFVLSGIVQYLISSYTEVHFLLYSITGLSSCFIISYIASILTPNRLYNHNKYTIYG